MCVLLAITAEKQEVVEARRGNLGTKKWDQATINNTLGSVKRDFNATSVTQHIRRLKRIPRLKRKGGTKTAVAEGLAYAGIGLLDWVLGWDQSNTIATIERRLAKMIELQAELKGPRQVKQMINRMGKCTNRDQSFILHDAHVLEFFRVFPGRVPCFACHCSSVGEIEHCRKCLRSEEITAGKEHEIEECYRDDGKAYRGSVQQTAKVDISGWLEINSNWRSVQCQAWSAQKPHEHGDSLYRTKDHDPNDLVFVPKYTPDTDAWAGLEGSFCRNPSGSKRPWCYTQSKRKRWAYCDIPKCENILGDHVRKDGRCGPRFLKRGKPGECDPDSENSCCNEERGVCGNTKEDCICEKCVDYWEIREMKRMAKKLGGRYEDGYIVTYEAPFDEDYID